MVTDGTIPPFDVNHENDVEKDRKKRSKTGADSSSHESAGSLEGPVRSQ
jgi:hypothetical protein